ncbi:MAG: hypothetical protein E7536_03680 [Ruminococcaceae bacterium]|nr:hypothetical protein [Oscillospiraceae bacterium]
MQKNVFSWVTLDNGGRVFPGQNTRRWSNVFRLGVQLKEKIDPQILRDALEKTFERFPFFRVRMRKGFFWNYLEYNEKECPIKPDICNFCYRINFKENNGFLFRIFYHENRINIDFYHALCDGYGAMVFLSTLTGEYLRLKGYKISHNQLVLNVEDSFNAEEKEDAYSRYASTDAKSKLSDPVAYHKKGTRLPLHFANYTSAIMSFKEVHALCKKYGVTVTEFLGAVLLDIHCRKALARGKKHKNVSVQIPINLRKHFSSRTMGNFVLCLLVKFNIGAGEFTFEDVLKSVSTQLKENCNEKAMNAYITKTHKLGNKTIKFVPLVIKNFFVKVFFNLTAEYSTSVLLSNLGPVILPEDMKQHVEKYCLHTGAGLVNGARCGVVSCKDNLVLTFSNCYEEDDIEKDFLQQLVNFGIGVTVETNRNVDFTEIEGITAGDKNAYSDKIYIPAKIDRIIRFASHDIRFRERFRRVFHT